MQTPTPNTTTVAHVQFERALARRGFYPDDAWINGYVSNQWRTLRPILSAYDIDTAGRRVLEFGSNIGASAIVLAKLGAQVVGVEVKSPLVELAKANAARYAVQSRAAFLHVADTRTIPLDDNSFDLVLACSVLEYAEPGHLPALISELHRVLRRDGLLFVTATASRVAPCELHSGRWLVNYVPRTLLDAIGLDLQQGLSPLQLARATRGLFENVSADGWRKARDAVHGSDRLSIKVVDRIARLAGVNPGWLAPNIELLLRKT